MKDIVPEKLSGVSRSFNLEAAKADAWHPRQFSYLSDDALRALADLLIIYQKTGMWAGFQEETLVSLIPKPDGDRRPILLYNALYRVWAKRAQDEVTRWAEEKLKGTSINNAACRITGDGLWRTAVRDNMAIDGGGYSAEMMWDITKAFDNVDRLKLLQKGGIWATPCASLC
jgi:hypothetical protein